MEIAHPRCRKDGNTVRYCFSVGRSAGDEEICFYSERYDCILFGGY